MEVVFVDGKRIEFEMPRIKTGGLMWGERSTRFVGVVVARDRDGWVKGVVKIGGKVNKKKVVDSLSGKIYNYKEINEKPAKSRKQKDKNIVKYKD